ncbi:MAG: radical SAM protein [Oscillospiraceae bacterium]|jgi:uncharacterized radical SAM superfamily Fe-S cluster-containing enzyme|nr:radical SAM protein [Oscillospiraceae bacterium]
MSFAVVSRRVGETHSVCPVCLKRIPARLLVRRAERFLEKTCPEHGKFSAVIWRGEEAEFAKWWDARPSGNTEKCPNACGLCENHLTKTCCALVEITSRCNLRCPVCFADAGNAAAAREPTVAELYDIFCGLAARGRTFVQLSGGEPTVRDDLPEIIAAARRAGCETVQLNSNGLRLGAEPDFARALAEAGLSFVFMQFDGVTDAPYLALRGRALLSEKLRAIEVCDDIELGVTLVPTVVPGVNDSQIGAIAQLAMSRSPAVRGVHFQPVSYFGRYPAPPRDKDRITLPEILRALQTQTGAKIKISDFLPSSCDHPRCGFHGDFVVLPDGKLMRLTAKYAAKACCDDGDAHLKNRAFVSRRWKRETVNSAEDTGDYTDMTSFLSRVKSHGFTITGMAFQDAYTLELDRLIRCSLHVLDSKCVKPFCARYITEL